MDNTAKVEQFLLLAKNARGLALADLIGKATAEPGLFTFGELISLPATQEVSWCDVKHAGWGLGGSYRRIDRCAGSPGWLSPRPPGSSCSCPQLQHSEHSAAYNLLQLFAYGTWQEYRGEAPQFRCSRPLQLGTLGLPAPMRCSPQWQPLQA